MPLGIRWLWVTLGLLAVSALAVTALGGLLVLLALAGLLAVGLRPAVRALEGRGVPHRLAVPLIFLGAVAAGAGLVAMALPPLLEQAAALAQALPNSAAELAKVGARWEVLSERLAFLPSLPEMTNWLTARAGAYMRGLVRWTGQLVGLIGSGVTIALILFYLLSDGRRLMEQGLLLVPPHRRDGARAWLMLLGDRLGRYTLGTLTDLTLVGTLAGVGFWLVGVPNALLLGVFVGALNIVPFVGALVGAVPALLVAFGISPQTGFAALAVVIVVQQLDGLAIYPRVVGQAVGLHPLYVLIALTAGSQLGGLPGVLLSIPAAIVIKTVLETRVVPWVQDLAPPPPARLETSPAVTFAPLPGQTTSAPLNPAAPAPRSPGDDSG
jgi:predicted PurR-regulated permease PerM